MAISSCSKRQSWLGDACDGLRVIPGLQGGPWPQAAASARSWSTPSHRCVPPQGAALAYATISVCITFFNKAIFSYYHFKHPGFMTGVQILFSLCFLT